MYSAAMPGWQTSCFASLLAVVLTLIHKFHPYPGTYYPESNQLADEYDFVIVGAGSAVAVVANRLSEIPNWSVLLLEAGGRETELSQIPLLTDRLRDTELDWKFRTAPPSGEQRYCLAMNNLECKWPRGKVLGGSSVINTMAYVRGNRHDFDHWESLGNRGWGYDQVLKYFLKSENNSNPFLLNTPYHAAGGYLCVQDELFYSPIASVFLEAAKYLGYENADFNGRNQMALAHLQVTECQGSRCSTTRAFLLPIRSRPNLSTLLYSLVRKINFDLTTITPKATSVSFTRNDNQHTVRAKKEVKLCAGSISTPQILMLSGIGPKEDLEGLRMKLVKDLRVGYNLQDHPGTVLTFKTDKPVTLKPSDTMTPDTRLEFYLEGQGPLTSPGGSDGIGFINTQFGSKYGIPDVEFQFRGQSLFNGDKPFGERVYNLRPDLFNGTGYENLQNASLFEIQPNLLRVESRGRIKLRSSNPYDHPIIDPNYFAERQDVSLFVAGCKKALELVATPPFKALHAAPLGIPFPGCERYTLYSKELGKGILELGNLEETSNGI